MSDPNEEMLLRARRGQTDAEQLLLRERDRRHDLEQEPQLLRAERAGRRGLLAQLKAERRRRVSEAELEWVTRRAAEFEYGLRAAAADAVSILRQLGDRVGLVRAGGSRDELAPAREPPAGDASPAVEAAAPLPGAHESITGRENGAPALDSGRLDAALERLRAAAPRAEDAG